MTVTPQAFWMGTVDPRATETGPFCIPMRNVVDRGRLYAVAPGGKVVAFSATRAANPEGLR